MKDIILQHIVSIEFSPKTQDISYEWMSKEDKSFKAILRRGFKSEDGFWSDDERKFISASEIENYISDSRMLEGGKAVFNKPYVELGLTNGDLIRKYFLTESNAKNYIKELNNKLKTCVRI